jgi:hypothetical protein
MCFEQDHQQQQQSQVMGCSWQHIRIAGCRRILHHMKERTLEQCGHKFRMIGKQKEEWNHLQW